METELATLLSAVRTAGAAVLNFKTHEITKSYKKNNDLVTAADLIVNGMLKDQLLTAFPGYGWLSEECSANAERLEAERIWIVDPIDGTKEFVQGIPEYAISVALIEKQQAILAAIYNPATDELFHAIYKQGAWLNNVKIHCAATANHEHYLLLASRSEHERGEWDRFESVQRVQVMGSIAYKLALVAAGRADATFSLGPKNEWDIAAGVLLVAEAGGIVTNQQQQAFMFNQPNLLVDGIIASRADIYPAIIQLIATT